MSKFGLDAFENEAQTEESPSLAERLAAFPPSGPRTHIDLAAVDAAAAPHGFTSREPAIPGPAPTNEPVYPQGFVPPPPMVPFYPPAPNYPPAPLYPQAAAAAAAAQQSALATPPPAPVAPAPVQGYTSAAVGYPPPYPGRRRRAISYEPTRHLAVRLTETQYQRFVAFADEHRLTYHDALQKLMDEHDAIHAGS